MVDYTQIWPRTQRVPRPSEVSFILPTSPLNAAYRHPNSDNRIRHQLHQGGHHLNECPSIVTHRNDFVCVRQPRRTHRAVFPTSPTRIGRENQREKSLRNRVYCSW